MEHAIEKDFNGMKIRTEIQKEHVTLGGLCKLSSFRKGSERHKMPAAESCEVGIACTAEAQAPGQDDVERGPRGSMLNQE